MLEIAGCIITIDAMGCHKGIAAEIIKQKADYVLALKANQGKLYDQVEQWFEQARGNGFAGIDCSYHLTTESGHHRIETRGCLECPRCSLGGIAQPGSMERLAECGYGHQ